MSNDIERAAHAARLLENPLFEESFQILREGYLQALMACKADDDMGRLSYTMALRSLETQRNHWKTVLTRGQLISKQVKQVKFEDPSAFTQLARKLY